ncbi:MAG TPA: YtxH domain-containing protein [Holophagaceae bacterium]|nr:YtxH domain-containing protein [Holophagaceae bacterium]
MSQDSVHTTTTFLLTFLAGAAVGALITAFTTPKSGPELREDLREFGWKVRRRAARAASDLRRGVHDAAEDLRG